MDNKEYGVKLTVDISDLKKKLADATKLAQNTSKKLENSMRKVKITDADGTREIEIKANTKDVEEAKKKIIDLKTEEEKLADVQKRISQGQIKITNLLPDEAEMAANTKEYDKIRQSMSGPIDQYYSPEQLSFFQDLDTEPTQQQIQNFVNNYKTAMDEVKSSTESTKTGWDIFENAVNKAKSGVQNLNNELKKATSEIPSVAKNMLKSLTNGLKNVANKALSAAKNVNLFKKNNNSLNTGLSRGVANLKRFALSLFGIQTMWRAVSKAASAYLSYDQELSKTIQNTWAGFGSFLAPILEYLTSAFQKLLAYANAVIKVLTGIDYVARANKKAMDNTTASVKKANKALASFDELQNINQDTGSGGTGGNGTITVPDVDTGSITEIFEKLRDLFKEGKYYEIGELISNKIADSLEKIDWNKIKSKAKSAAKGIAETLNGAIENERLWETLGKTLGESVNTAVSSLGTFVKTLNWSAFGKGVGKSITTAITTINWQDFFQTLADTIQGLADFLTGILTETDWGACTEAVIDGIFNTDWDGMTASLSKFVGALLGALVKVLVTGIVKIADNTKKTIDDSIKQYFDEGGTSLGEALLTGIGAPFKKIEEWLEKSITTPFIDGFKKAFGIEKGDTTSTETQKQGKALAQGILDGIIMQFFPGWALLSNSIKEKFGLGVSKSESTAKKGGKKVGKNLSDGLAEGFDGTALKNDWGTKFKNAFNKLIDIFNKFGERLNKKFKFSVGGTFAKLSRDLLGISLPTKMSIASDIGSIPKLRIGTDNVNREGLAYLHAGEKVVPADVVKGGYTEEGNNNEETNDLLRQLIDVIQDKDFNPYITVDDIGKASVKYINNKSRITGGSVI